MAGKRALACQWCGTEIEKPLRGRPRKYCSQSCRQRAYEQRNAVVGTVISSEAVIITPDRAHQLQDSLFELRCAAEDIQTAVAEGAHPDEVAALCAELVGISKSIEQLRLR
ncbi:hypothetical protein N7326_00290 [Corynebacterium sp. ES2794-CONJ1]|uniref:hypothetical protein n=1 Tax=unclassified Corynebacterium TaxID=2624378 RepID=UPI0021675FE5|nr:MULTISPECIES: hypothetical protein [unclassified Corynebacterium]MCS4489362.1 hypothetical protein [Corynebacterium sp. ES2775-CONJ]MCS4530944.1 hypothetical protein [Corynebacterium sp. ES2730-CONJ]MCU9518311.1 hypothetical protein [Corynebacterium sp. ES2794-CONJ1]